MADGYGFLPVSLLYYGQFVFLTQAFRLRLESRLFLFLQNTYKIAVVSRHLRPAGDEVKMFDFSFCEERLYRLQISTVKFGEKGYPVVSTKFRLLSPSDWHLPMPFVEFCHLLESINTNESPSCSDEEDKYLKHPMIGEERFYFFNTRIHELEFVTVKCYDFGKRSANILDSDVHFYPPRRTFQAEAQLHEREQSSFWLGVLSALFIGKALRFFDDDK